MNRRVTNKPAFPLALVHVRPKIGCAFMLISTRTGKVRNMGYGKSCRRPARFALGAPSKCQKCGHRIYLQPLGIRQSRGIRCFDCFKVFCFRCLRMHFRLKCKVVDGGKWKGRRRKLTKE